MQTDQLKAERKAEKVSFVCMTGNVILTGFKLLAGLLAHSGVMVSDAVHSASDVLGSLIVIVGLRLSARDADKSHPYGHERFECVAAIVLAVVLVIIGGLIGLRAVESIADGSYKLAEMPGILALIAAIVSIVVKAMMFLYARYNAAKLHFTALKAEAWHHLSDALSSIGALIGIVGARMGFPILDPIVSILICVLILKAAIQIFRDAIDQMVDHSCDAQEEEELRRCAEAQEGVLGVDLLHTRVFGNRIYVDMEIRADRHLSLEAGHDIAERVHSAIENGFPQVKHIMVHVNPGD